LRQGGEGKREKAFSAVRFLSARSLVTRDRATVGLWISDLSDLAGAIRERLRQAFGWNHRAELKVIRERLREEITAREHLRQKLQESEANFRRITDTSLDTIVVTTFADNRLIDANLGFEQLGYRRAEGIGRTWAELGIWPEPQQYEEFRRRLAADGMVREMEVSIRNRSGVHFPATISGALIELDGETCAATIVRDLSAFRRVGTEPGFRAIPASRAFGDASSRVGGRGERITTALQLTGSSDWPERFDDGPIRDGDAAARAKEGDRGNDAVDGRVVRVLLIEDSFENRLLIRAFLRKLPCQLDEAENGEIGVRKFVAGSYDVVLMDLHMPVMDGVTATRMIREWEERHGAERTAVIALTASAVDDEVQQMLEAGADLGLLKPINRAALFEALESLTGAAVDERIAAGK
jgi:PAS domain S-box-containing protein